MAYGLGMLKGFGVTLKHLFRPTITQEYPDVDMKIPARFRGFDFAWDIERCTACCSCAKACPHGVIIIETSPGPFGKYKVDRFDINRAKCMFCALCVEACPYEAIHMGTQREMASYTYDGLWTTKEKLIDQWYNLQIKDPTKLPSAYVRPQFDVARKQFPNIPKVGHNSD